MLLKTIAEEGKFLKYIKAKGWVETPPLYRGTPPGITERLSSVEAAGLWDHLTLRYDNIKTTEVSFSFAYDGDFKATLNGGLKTLKNQANTLEKELDRFGIPLPKRSGTVSASPSNTDILSDDHLYRTMLIGLRAAGMLHAQTIKESTFNDRVRSIFKKMLVDEIMYTDNYYKFGKLKGWLNQAPLYGS